MPKVQEQHIAVFGESGSGKTVLLSSFFGPTQEGPHSNGLWDLIADDTGQGNRLYKNYLGMRDRAAAPLPTRFKSESFQFTVKPRKSAEPAASRSPFDALRLVWHDYPGEWFEESPSTEEEETRRLEGFRTLLRSDVALLLVDGQKVLNHRDEEERYLKSLLTNYRQGLLRLKDDLLADEGPRAEFPRIWLFALTKADLLPDWDAYIFRDLMVRAAAEHIEALRRTIAELVDTPAALSVGEDYMVLSSAKFELLNDDAEPAAIDVTKRVGLDLILPIASILPLERRVQWHEQMELPRKVSETFADNADAIAAVLTAGGVVEKLLGRLPKVGRYAKKLHPIVIRAVERSGKELRDLNARARADQDFVTATVTQLKLDFEKGIEDRLLLRRK
jgi:hypothetical protein